MAEITSHYRREGEFSLIEIRLGAVQQLFNSFDPSPFHEKDLDADAEDYIVGAVRELPLKTPLKLGLLPAGDELAAPAIATLAESIHHYFDYRREGGGPRSSLPVAGRALCADRRPCLPVGVPADPSASVRGGRSDSPHHRRRTADRRMGRNVAADGNFSVRVVAATTTPSDLYEAFDHPGGGPVRPFRRRQPSKERTSGKVTAARIVCTVMMPAISP